MYKVKNYSIILPTLNEAGHIKILINQIKKIFNKKKIKHEILIIDDNSNDGTIQIVKKLSKNNKNIKIFVRRNKTKSLVESLKEGIQKSKNNFIIWMDADFSHPPEKIKNFIIQNKKKDYDAIIFSRFLKKSIRYYQKENLSPKMIDNLSYILNKMCMILISKKFTDYTSGYICIKKEIVKNINISGYYGDYFIGLLFKLFKDKRKTIELPYKEKDRATGFSKTTGNKINLIIKCYYYLYAILKCVIKKLI